MVDILHDLSIRADADRVFDAMATPDCLDAWWKKSADGKPKAGDVLT